MSSAHETLPFAVYMPKSNLGQTRCYSALVFGLEYMFSKPTVCAFMGVWPVQSHGTPHLEESHAWFNALPWPFCHS